MKTFLIEDQDARRLNQEVIKKKNVTPTKAKKKRKKFYIRKPNI